MSAPVMKSVARAGDTSKKPVADKLVPLLERAGAAAVTIHGRSAEQRYKRAADWDLIEQVAADVNVPVIGNGDLLTHYEVEKRRRGNTHAQMIGRGALIKPWIFQEAEQVPALHTARKCRANPFRGRLLLLLLRAEITKECSCSAQTACVHADQCPVHFACLQGAELAPSAEDRVAIYRQFVSYMKDYFHDDDLGKKRAFYFLPWHFCFFSRYRPLPQSAYQHLTDEGTPLIGYRQGVFAGEVRSGMPGCHDALANQAAQGWPHYKHVTR